MPVAYVGAAAGLASTIGGLAGGGSNQSYGGAGGGSPYFYQPTGPPQPRHAAQGSGQPDLDRLADVLPRG